MDDNMLNKIYGKPIDVHIRHDHGETETRQRELEQDPKTEDEFRSEPAEMNRQHE